MKRKTKSRGKIIKRKRGTNKLAGRRRFCLPCPVFTYCAARNKRTTTLLGWAWFYWLVTLTPFFAFCRHRPPRARTARRHRLKEKEGKRPVSHEHTIRANHLFVAENMKNELSLGRGFDFFWLLMDELLVVFPALCCCPCPLPLLLAAPFPPPVPDPPFPPPPDPEFGAPFPPASRLRGPPATPEEPGSCW